MLPTNIHCLWRPTSCPHNGESVKSGCVGNRRRQCCHVLHKCTRTSPHATTHTKRVRGTLARTASTRKLANKCALRVNACVCLKVVGDGHTSMLPTTTHLLWRPTSCPHNGNPSKHDVWATAVANGDTSITSAQGHHHMPPPTQNVCDALLRALQPRVNPQTSVC